MTRVLEEERIESDQMEVYESDIDLYLQMFCEENKIEDLKKESQSVWNGCMRYIRKHVFATPEVLKSKTNTIVSRNSIPSNFNAYDYEKVNSICDKYIDLCFIHDKEVSILGFCNLTGINNETINLWGDDNGKLSPLSFGIYKKLNEMREESLSNKLVTGKQNPVGVLGVLNRHYQWNMPGVRDQQRGKAALTADQLPRLGQNAALLSDNSVTDQS